jgi:hypothetical protein
MLSDLMRMPRSQRVVIDIPVCVRVNRGGATPVEEITKTVIVNGNGALIKLSALVVVPGGNAPDGQCENPCGGQMHRCQHANRPQG